MIGVHRTFATEAEARAFKDNYLANYHPQGYGTFLEVVENPDGSWLVHGWRGNSCD